MAYYRVAVTREVTVDAQYYCFHCRFQSAVRVWGEGGGDASVGEEPRAVHEAELEAWKVARQRYDLLACPHCEKRQSSALRHWRAPLIWLAPSLVSVLAGCVVVSKALGGFLLFCSAASFALFGVIAFVKLVTLFTAFGSARRRSAFASQPHGYGAPQGAR